MIDPVLLGRYLFIRNGCPHCQIYKKFIFKLNSELRIDKRINIIDCTNYDLLRVCDNPIIKVFEKYLDGYPTLFIDGEKKSGANSVIECKAFIKARLFNEYYFGQENEFLITIGKPTMSNLDCKHREGGIICEEE